MASNLNRVLERLKGTDSESAANDIILTSIPKDPDAASLEISLLFGPSGILAFLKYQSIILPHRSTRSDSSHAPARKILLDFITNLIESGHCERNSSDILSACIAIFQAKEASRVIASIFPVLSALIDRELPCDEEIGNLWELMDKQTLLGKMKATVQGLVLELMGRIAYKYSNLITGDEREQYLRFLNSVLVKRDPDAALVAGCFLGLSEYLKFFTLESSFDTGIIITLFISRQKIRARYLQDCSDHC
jgi:hypothetical protein